MIVYKTKWSLPSFSRWCFSACHLFTNSSTNTSSSDMVGLIPVSIFSFAILFLNFSGRSRYHNLRDSSRVPPPRASLVGEERVTIPCPYIHIYMYIYRTSRVDGVSIPCENHCRWRDNWTSKIFLPGCERRPYCSPEFSANCYTWYSRFNARLLYINI